MHFPWEVAYVAFRALVTSLGPSTSLEREFLACVDVAVGDRCHACSVTFISVSLDSGPSAADWLVAIAALMTAGVAIVAVIYARAQVAVARTAREDVIRPYVVAYLTLSRVSQQFVNLEFRNYGQTAAYDIEVVSDEPLVRSRDGAGAPIRMFDKLSILAPGETWTTVGDNLITRKGAGLPTHNTIVIKYWSEHPRKQHTTECTIDWISMENRSFVEEKGLHHVAKTLDKLAGEVETIRRELKP